MKNYQITDWVQHFVKNQVKEGDCCIDATMGNGHDTLYLAKLVGRAGRVYAFDIQTEALAKTKERLKKEQLFDRCKLILDSHENMARYVEEKEISCIMFNFGYLPGGDHKKATKAKSSLTAIDEGLKLLKRGGLMTLCIYSGGDSGFEEKDAILDYVQRLDSKKYLAIKTEYSNRKNNPPIPVLIVRL